MMNEQYCYVEFFEGAHSNRGNIITESELPKPNGRAAYASVFRFDESLKKYVKANGGSIANYTGKHTAKNVIWDFDSDESRTLEDVHKDVKSFLGVLNEVYSVPDDVIEIFFSGSKGFHISLSIHLFTDDPKAEIDFNKRVQRVTQIMADSFRYDTKIYNLTRYLRVENSKHPDSELYKIPLLPSEVRKLPITEIKTLAMNPREIERDTDEYGILEELAHTWKEARKQLDNERPKPKNENTRKQNIPGDIWQMIAYYAENQPDYQQWIEDVGFPFASLGEPGREFFVKLSILNEAYPDETEQSASEKFDGLLRDFNNRDDKQPKRNFASFIRRVRELGYAPLTIEMDEDSIAERFTGDLSGELMYVTEIGRWFQWDGHRWKIDETKTVIFDYVRRVVDQYLNEGERITADDERKKFNTFKKAFRSHRKRDDLKRNLETRPEFVVSQNSIDQKNGLFNCANGAIDLDAINLEQSDKIPVTIDPGNYLTLSSPVHFDPQAECPNWEQFLQDWFVDPAASDEDQAEGREIISFLQRAVGYSLSGHTSEHALFFLYGSGRNGKSTFLEAIKKLMGDYSWKANMSTLLHRNDNGAQTELAQLRGRRFVVASEIEEGSRLHESLVKDLTGGDHINARHLYESSFIFKPVMKLWIGGNHKPKVKGTDFGIRRRIKLIPFLKQIPEEKLKRSEDVERIIDSELPGILNWAIMGYHLWKNDGGLKEPDVVLEHTQKFFDENDIVKTFLDECCEIDPDMGQGASSYAYKIKAQELYKALRVYADESNIRIPNRQKFYREMQGKGFEMKRGTGGHNYFYGVQVLQVADEDGNQSKKMPF